MGDLGVGEVHNQSVNAEDIHKLDVHNSGYSEFTYHLPLNITYIKTEEKMNSYTLILMVEFTIIPQEK